MSKRTRMLDSTVLLSLSQRYGHLSQPSGLSNTQMKSTMRRASKIVSSNFLLACFLLISVLSAAGQAGGLSPFSAPLPTQSTSESNAPAVNPGASINSRNPLFGSVPEGKATRQEMPLSIMDTIGLGLRHNLGLILNQVGTESAHAARVRALADLLPNVTGT